VDVILGSEWSGLSIACSEVTNFVSLISSSATSDALSNKDTHKNFNRICTINSAQVLTAFGICKK